MVILLGFLLIILVVPILIGIFLTPIILAGWAVWFDLSEEEKEQKNKSSAPKSIK